MGGGGWESSRGCVFARPGGRRKSEEVTDSMGVTRAGALRPAREMRRFFASGFIPDLSSRNL